MEHPMSRVVVQDFGVDAALVQLPDEAVLVLRPGQSISSAVSAVTALLPGFGADQARSLVRDAFPHNIDVAYNDAAAKPDPSSCPPGHKHVPSWALWVCGVTLGVHTTVTTVLAVADVLSP
jgi:hypothetical protein